MRHRALKLLASILVPGVLLLASSGQAADIQKRALKLSSANNKGHPQVTGAQKFADLVSEKSSGKISVKLFPGGVLGPDVQNISAMQGGTLDFMVGNASLLAGNAKEFALLDFPFLFDNVQEADAVMDGPLGKKLFAKLPDRGLVGLAYWELGFRHINTAKKPVNKAEDIAGMKLRAFPTPIYIDFLKALGVNPVPMPFTETYTALETGAVDGMTNPLINIVDSKFYEVAKYVTLTDHMYNPQWLGISKKTWDKLSEDERRIIQDAATEATAVQRQASREATVKALDELKQRGIQVTQMPPEEIAKLREKSMPVIEKYKKEIGEELVTEIYAEVEKVRGKN